jgi:hypothetical protein
MAQVAAMLAEQGLAVTEAVLKVYLRRARQPTSRTSKPKKPRSAGRAEHAGVGSENRPVRASTPLGNAASSAREKDMGTEQAARGGNEAATHQGRGGTELEEGGRKGNVAYPGTPSAPAAPPIAARAALRKDAGSNSGADGSVRSTSSGRFVPREDTEDL